MENNYISKYSVDIISCLFDYICEEILPKYLRYIFLALEDNNIFTTLIELQKNKNKELDNVIIMQLIIDSLDMLTYDEKRYYNPKFLFNYKIPGFYNFNKNLSDYINNNIIIDYFNLEKNLRKFDPKVNSEEKLNEFYKKEKQLLSLVYDFINYNDEFFIKYIEKMDIP